MPCLQASVYLRMHGASMSVCVCVASHLPSLLASLRREELSDLCGPDPDCYLAYKWNTPLKYCFILHAFGLLWSQQVSHRLL